MMIGIVRKGFPRLTVELAGRSGTESAEFVVDTGFDGDLALSANAVRDPQTTLQGVQIRSTADGNYIQVEVHTARDRWREVELLVLGGSPLLGMTLLNGSHVDIEATEGGELLIETL